MADIHNMPDIDIDSSFNILIQQGLMEVAGYRDGETLYTLTDEGKKYVEQNLLKGKVKIK